MSEPFPYTTMVELLHYWSCHDSHRPAFIFTDKHGTRFELTRGQLYQLGGRWAAVLQAGGVEGKERVVSTLPNSPERVLCDVGIVMAGAVMVNAQCQLADDLDLGPWQVLRQHVQHHPVTNTVTSVTLPDLQKVFFIRRTAPLCQDPGLSGPASTGRSDPESDNTEKKNFVGDGFASPETGDFIACLRVLDEFYEAEVSVDETVVVFTTSGSTGFSKLVPHTHASLIKCFQFLKQGSLDQYSLAFNSAPLGWLGGYPFLYLSVGKGRLLLDMWYGAPDDLAAAVWNLIVKEGCVNSVIMPFLLPKILALEDRQPWKMKGILVSGQPLKKEVILQALQLSESVLVTYTGSELLMTTVTVVRDSSSYQDFLAGKPLPNCSVKVCDSDGKEVTRGAKGEIHAKTPWMTQGYLSAEDTAASFTADGFLKTGDVGQMLEDGSLLVEGRQHDAIHRGSYIFYPAWLESRIISCCPGLSEVFVVGVPNPGKGEELCACFVASDPSITEEHVRSVVEEDITAKLDDPLSPRPRYYLRFQAFPTTFTGKPVRKEVRRQAVDRLNLA
ncbi:2-succinylbenzoate--CoA ligase-like isoform X2 [Babylonia areolata]|uniref:2-succinylbenzoate--CoA ligase-like isoform X2 n=1 Tax=Babylonia areolata TaxID=304850 RepID=UPI003FD3DA4B